MRCSLAVLGVATSVALFGCAPGANGSGVNTIVVMETSMGSIKIELFDDDAPITVKNFLRYVDAKHYDGTIFHRVIQGFMNQGGGLDTNHKEKLPNATPIRNEASNGKQNKRGTIAMARTSVPDSATDQFFINVADNIPLDRKPGQGNEGYAVFGKVIDGMDVMDKINRVKTNRQDDPLEMIVIKSVKRVNP